MNVTAFPAEIARQLPSISIEGGCCFLRFADTLFGLSEICIKDRDIETHITSYRGTDVQNRPCEIIVNCGAEPPFIEIVDETHRQSLAFSEITHAKQDELNHRLSELCSLAEEA